jgi:hypothetical protein
MVPSSPLFQYPHAEAAFHWKARRGWDATKDEPDAMSYTYRIFGKASIACIRFRIQSIWSSRCNLRLTTNFGFREWWFQVKSFVLAEVEDFHSFKLGPRGLVECHRPELWQLFLFQCILSPKLASDSTLILVANLTKQPIINEHDSNVTTVSINKMKLV